MPKLIAMQVPYWISILQGLLTPTMAAFGGYIAWQQWKTEQNKLRLDLFDRRFLVFQALRDFMSEVRSRGRVSDRSLFEFN